MLPERIGVFWPWRRRSACRWPAPRRPRRPSPAAARARELVIGLPYVAPPPVAGAKIRTPDGLDVAAAEAGPEPGPAVQPAPVDRGRSRPRAGLGTGGSGAGRARGRRVAAAVPGAQLAWQGTGYAVRPKAVIRSDTRMRSGADTRGRRVCMAQATAAQAQARAWGPRCAPIACLPMRWWRCERAIATWASSTTRCGSR